MIINAQLLANGIKLSTEKNPNIYLLLGFFFLDNSSNVKELNFFIDVFLRRNNTLLYKNKLITYSLDHIFKRLDDSIDFVVENLSCNYASPFENLTHKRKLPAGTLMR